MVNMLSFGGAREKCVRKLAEGEGAMGKVHAFAMDDGLGSDEQFGSEDVVDDQANVVSDGAGDESQRGRSGSPCSQSQSSSASPVPELSNQNSIGEYDEEEAQEDAVSDKELESNSIDVQSVVDAFIAYEKHVMAGLKRKREEIDEFVQRVGEADEKYAQYDQRIVQFGHELETKQKQICIAARDLQSRMSQICESDH